MAAAHQRIALGRKRESCHYPVDSPSRLRDVPHLGVAEPRGGLDERVEHRLQIEGRAADDLEHVAGRGLVFERFLEIAGALLQFAEQPRILHRDHRLRREVFEQRNLLFGERSDFVAMDVDDAEKCALAAQRHREPGANISKLEPFARDGAFAKRLGLAHVGDMDDAFAAREGIIQPSWLTRSA